MPDNLKKPCKDHEGTEFTSVKEMILSWSLTPERFYQRLSRGWSLKRALTTPIKRRK